MADQRHHWIPISLYGIDSNVNIVPVNPETHIHIHQIMNYDHRTYSKMYRSFRRRNNSKSKWDLTMIEDIIKMQKGYLDRYTLLAPGPQITHFKMMNALTSYYKPSHGFDGDWKYLWPKYVNAFKTFHI